MFLSEPVFIYVFHIYNIALTKNARLIIAPERKNVHNILCLFFNKSQNIVDTLYLLYFTAVVCYPLSY